AQGPRARLALEDRPIAEASLLVLLLSSILCAGVCTLLPLFLRARGGPSLFRRGGAMFTYFSALGLGFMVAELGLVHKPGLELGSPTFTFAPVVGNLLLFSGRGAYWSGRLQFETVARRVLVACIAVISIFLGVGSLVTSATLGLGLGVRICIAVLLV